MTFCNPGAKLDTIALLLKKMSCQLTYFARAWPDWFRCECECRHRVIRLKWPVKHISHDANAAIPYGTFLTWSDMRPLLRLAWALTYMPHPSSLQRHFDKVWIRCCLWVWFLQAIRRKVGVWPWPDIWPFEGNLRLHENPLIESFRWSPCTPLES